MCDFQHSVTFSAVFKFRFVTKDPNGSFFPFRPPKPLADYKERRYKEQEATL